MAEKSLPWSRGRTSTQCPGGPRFESQLIMIFDKKIWRKNISFYYDSSDFEEHLVAIIEGGRKGQKKTNVNHFTVK